MIKEREREEEDMNNAIREEDFLDSIISNEDLNYEEKVSIVLDILLGGFETSATTLSLVVYFLAKSPNLLHKLKVFSLSSHYLYICACIHIRIYVNLCERIQEEHAAIRAKKGDGELLNWEDYQKMEFTQCVCFINPSHHFILFLLFFRKFVLVRSQVFF